MLFRSPLRGATILFSILCIAVGLFGVPIKLLAFPPLVWTVLLFGIFMPLTLVGISKWKEGKGMGQKVGIGLLAIIGIAYSPIVTWVGAVLIERIRFKPVKNLMKE